MDDVITEYALKKLLNERMFGRLVENRWRGDVVEEIVARALAPLGWSHCSGDWNSWDLEHAAQRLKMQVKQSARQQTWGVTKLSKYGIAPAKGFYARNVWKTLPIAQRLSDVYLFAHHPVEGEGANHWDVRQWQFTVVAENELPNTKSITGTRLAQWASSDVAGLAEKVSSVCLTLVPNGRAESANATDAGPTDDTAEQLSLWDGA